MCAGWDADQVKAVVAETLHAIVDPVVFAGRPSSSPTTGCAAVPMREEVGNPTVVNPDRALRKEAAQRDMAGVDLHPTFTRPVPLRERFPARSTAA